MNARKRIRVELDSESFECLKYFSLLRGVPIGRACSRVLAVHATAVEAEFPPIRAHMLAWRNAYQMGSDAVEAKASGEIPF